MPRVVTCRSRAKSLYCPMRPDRCRPEGTNARLSEEQRPMPEAPKPQDAPRRHGSEYEDNHYHDDDEVAQPPADEDALSRPRQPPRPTRKLPPPPRRFVED